MGKKKNATPGDDRFVALLEMEAYKNLFERAIIAQKVTHYPAHSRRTTYVGIGGWTSGDLKDLILEAHLWPNGTERPPFTRWEMERAIPETLMDELLNNPPTEPAIEPASTDHSRRWVCYLCHQPPALDTEEYDELLADEERYRTLRTCPLFRATLTAYLREARKRARELTKKHGQRFTLDRYGRLIVPPIAAPTHWINRRLLKGEREERYAIGEIDQNGYQLVELRIEGRTPQERAALREAETYGCYYDYNENGEAIQTRIVAHVAQLISRWVWVEPADGERVPYTRVPHEGIVQVLKRGKPGDFVVVHRGYDTEDDGIDTDATVVYRRREALPASVLERLCVKKTAAQKRDDAPSHAPIVAGPQFADDSLFSTLSS